MATTVAHRNDSIEKGEKLGDRGWFFDRKLPAKGPRMVLPAGPLSALMQVFQLKDKLRFEKKTEKDPKRPKEKRDALRC